MICNCIQAVQSLVLTKSVEIKKNNYTHIYNYKDSTCRDCVKSVGSFVLLIWKNLELNFKVLFNIY